MKTENMNNKDIATEAAEKEIANADCPSTRGMWVLAAIEKATAELQRERDCANDDYHALQQEMDSRAAQASEPWTVIEQDHGRIARLHCGKGNSVAVIKELNPAFASHLNWLANCHNATLRQWGWDGGESAPASEPPIETPESKAVTEAYPKPEPAQASESLEEQAASLAEQEMRDMVHESFATNSEWHDRRKAIILTAIEKATNIAYGKGILKGWEQSRAAHPSEPWTPHTLLEIFNRSRAKDQPSRDQAICDVHNATILAAQQETATLERERYRTASTKRDLRTIVKPNLDTPL